MSDWKDRYNPQMGFYINGDGWQPLIEYLTDTLEKKYPDKFEVVQIKEKFAGLRYYISFKDYNYDNEEDHKMYEDAYKIIGVIEGLSYYICEECGKRGHLRKHGYYLATQCEDCYSKEVARRDEVVANDADRQVSGTNETNDSIHTKQES